MKTYTEYRVEAEVLISQNPALLLKKINSIVLVSYLYFAGLVTGWVAVIGGLTAIVYYTHRMNLFIVAVFIAACTSVYIIIKSFIYRISSPQSYELLPQSHPELFTAIHEFEQKLSVKIDKVYLDENLNAGVVQDPRFGVLGGYRNVLRIGLQLFLLLSKDEFRSVLAHELAHISNNDSRSTGSVNRIRQSWSYLLSNIPENKYNSIGVKPILWYLKRMWPKMDAYTFAYSRMCEYKADAFSVQSVGVKTWREGMVKLYLSNQYIDTFWNLVNKEIRTASEPAHDVYDRLINYFTESIDEQKLQEWIRIAAFKRTGDSDTHPSFEDRLTAQKVDVSLHSLYAFFQSHSNQSAAKEYLGGNYTSVIQEFNQKRFFEVSKHWEEYVKYQKDLDEAVAKSDTESTDEVVWEKIRAIIQRDGLQPTEQYIDELLIKNPSDIKARVHKALILLDRNDSLGETFINTLLEEKLVSIIDVSQFLYAYYSKNNMREKALDLEKKVNDEYQKNVQISSEVDQLSLEDVLVEHSLSEEIIKKIHEFAFQNSKYIGNIHIAKRILKNDPSLETYVISILRKGLFNWSDIPDQELIDSLLKELSISAVVFVWHRNLFQYGKKVKAIPQSLIYGQEQLFNLSLSKKIFIGIVVLAALIAYPSVKYQLINSNSEEKNITQGEQNNHLRKKNEIPQIITDSTNPVVQDIMYSFEQFKKGLLNNNTVLAINYIDQETINYYARLLTLIKYGDKSEIQKQGTRNQIDILTVRCRFDQHTISNLNSGKDLLGLLITENLIDKQSFQDTSFFHSLELYEHPAYLQTMSSTESPFWTIFVKESDIWKINLTWVIDEDNTFMEEQVVKSGFSKDEFIWGSFKLNCLSNPTEEIWDPIAW